MTKKIDILYVHLIFESGISPGEGSHQNLLTVATDGRGNPVLRGSSIAGVLRHEFAMNQQAYWFGHANDHNGGGADSRFIIDDCQLDSGKIPIETSDHHLRNRHTGVVKTGGLFSMESCPPGTQGVVAIEIRSDSENKPDEIIDRLEKRFKQGLVFGGRSARGVGLAIVGSKGIVHRQYSLDSNTSDDLVKYVRETRAWRENPSLPENTQSEDSNSKTKRVAADDELLIEFNLKIPKGQDFLVAAGDESRPQTSVDSSGIKKWKLPGSTLRGTFKSWMSRLAAIDGKQVGDNLDHFLSLDTTEQKEHPSPGSTDDLNCPINSLFGSLKQKGRIHFENSYANAETGLEQLRKHVVIDQITGGAAEGLLFENTVLTHSNSSEKKSPIFPVRITLKKPLEKEVAWLAKTLASIHMGVVRIGSSKAAGRLELAGVPNTQGTLGKKMMESYYQALKIKLGPSKSHEMKERENRVSVSGILTKEKKDFVVEFELNGSSEKKPVVKNKIDLTPPLPIEGDQGIPVEIELDKKGKIKKVREASKAVIEQPKTVTSEPASPEVIENSGTRPFLTQKTSSPSSDDVEPKHFNDELGKRFHNVYTFVPFDLSKERNSLNLSTPDTLTGDEANSANNEKRYTGYVDLSFETLRPLMSCEAEPTRLENGEHPVYKALRVGGQVILPATGIRGSLRSLMTILTGGTLSQINPHAFLCQGRDVNLALKEDDQHSRGILAEVVTAGSYDDAGTVRIGETNLVLASDLENIFVGSLDYCRPANADSTDRAPDVQHLWAQLRGNSAESIGQTQDKQHQWKLKLSGMPIGQQRNKKEGLFKPSDNQLSLASELWADYAERNIGGARPDLQPGDLVWLELREQCVAEPSEEDVVSIQWARWGKRGKSIQELVEKRTPGYMHEEGLVDEVTNLFGQVNQQNKESVTSFAGRIRPENLVFDSSANILDGETLAVLCRPNGGCVPFYRKGNVNSITRNNPLKGYKVYRVESKTRNDGEHPPWSWKAQPIFHKGEPKNQYDRMNRTAELVDQGNSGKLRIAFRSLSAKELALLCKACSLPWRLGGGKPFGLGLCQPTINSVNDEFGQPLMVDQSEFKSDWTELVDDEVNKRADFWIATQRPVPFVRYPRGREIKSGSNNKGGHIWFSRHASMNMPKTDRVTDTTQKDGIGLQPRDVVDPLRSDLSNNGLLDNGQMTGQLLPDFDPADPFADLLYGYDGRNNLENGALRSLKP